MATTKLFATIARYVAVLAGCSALAVAALPGCTLHRCDDVRRSCREVCFYRCDRYGCYPVCELRCSSYCHDDRRDHRRSSEALEPVASESDAAATTAAGTAAAGERCEYHEDCSGGLACVEHDGHEARACEATPPVVVAPPRDE